MGDDLPANLLLEMLIQLSHLHVVAGFFNQKMDVVLLCLFANSCGFIFYLNLWCFSEVTII